MHAAVSEYSFSSTSGTYGEISGGTIHGSISNLDNESFMDIPLGFLFLYDGSSYSSVSINANGFLAMGPTISSSFIAISSSTGTNNIIAAMNRDLVGRDTGQLMSITTGTAPNRVFVVQWKNYRRIQTLAANDVFNFQIRLYENTNQIDVVYGDIVAATVSTAQTVQVGLRGVSNSDYSNRMTVDPHSWSNTTQGTTSSSTCRVSATSFPDSGLTFSWQPTATNPFATIAGKLFHDLNYNGVFDDGEPPLDFEVTLDGPVTQSVFPDPNGMYEFTDLPSGSYQVGVVIPSSWTIMNVDYTGKKYLNLANQQQSINNDFAIFNLVRPTDGPEQLFINGFNTGTANNVRPGAPGAPQQSAPVSPTSRLYNSTYITASRSGFEPDTLYIRKNQIVPMYMTSIDDYTHVMLFSDAGLSAVAIGVSPGETRGIYWKAYN
ncbi:MAG: SdrD B-like domain-containing protein, partial [Candidatus Cloacimonadaceae bacterium]|nr:SdrD B-like domain-containing protein [Candidatus Cloacimonadaceae bacterium]